MDIKNNENYRNHNIQYYKTDLLKYDYEKNGILRHCLPKILFKGNNILVTFLQLIDLKIIMLLKYIDRLKKFKNIMNY